MKLKSIKLKFQSEEEEKIHMELKSLDLSSFIKKYRSTGFLCSEFLLLHLRYVLLLMGFFFVSRPIYWRPLLFDFWSVWATTSQSQTKSILNSIVKVFFFWKKHFMWVCDVLGFFFFVLLVFFYWVSLFCSVGFLLLIRSSYPLCGTQVLQTRFPCGFFLSHQIWTWVRKTRFLSLISTL